jgi:uncharacterized alkaline shock family protein YloU
VIRAPRTPTPLASSTHQEAFVSDFMPDNPPTNSPASGAPSAPPVPGPAHSATPGAPASPPFAPPRPEGVRPGGPAGIPPAAPGAPAGPRPEAPRPPGPRPETPQATPAVKGRIKIADEVVEKVAALAALEVPGVADLGGDIERAIESVRERIGIGAKRGDQGVKADVVNNEVTVNVTVMVEYGHVVLEVARQVQANVARKTNRMLGLKVVEVNVTVDDVRTTKPEADGADEPA